MYFLVASDMGSDLHLLAVGGLDKTNMLHLHVIFLQW